ncbi:MAG TPA: hypothetical protein VOA87_23220 [Thermoanaerobaculia bacterium]|nr:hypothetical protein [Thermoanaerobaculia bacterium]
MSHRTSVTRGRQLLTLLSLLALAVTAGAAGAASPPTGSPEQRQSISDLRTVGTAMFTWYSDQMHARPKKAGGKHGKSKGAEPKSVDVAGIPVISHDDLAKLLVPKYIVDLPSKDGWGNPYEFRLSTQDLDAQRIMAMRSGGGDGKFSGDSYEIGSFAPADQGQDLVWVDGYFSRWPQAQ